VTSPHGSVYIQRGKGGQHITILAFASFYDTNGHICLGSGINTVATSPESKFFVITKKPPGHLSRFILNSVSEDTTVSNVIGYSSIINPFRIFGVIPPKIP
jgi:hypothetical protein